MKVSCWMLDFRWSQKRQARLRNGRKKIHSVYNSCLSTWRRKTSATSWSSATIQSVCALSTRKKIKTVNPQTIHVCVCMFMWGRKCQHHYSRKKKTSTCLPCWWIWSMAACSSSTISTVQAIELYSWWKVGASGMFNSLHALCPPNKVTPGKEAPIIRSLISMPCQ